MKKILLITTIALFGLYVQPAYSEDLDADAYIEQVVENFSCEVKKTCAEYGFSQTLDKCLNTILMECPFGDAQAVATYFCSTPPTTNPICDEGKVYIASDKSCRAYCPSDSIRQGTGCKCSDVNKVYSIIANKCICKPSMVWNGSSCVACLSGTEYAVNNTSDDIPSPLVAGYNVVPGEGYCEVSDDETLTTCPGYSSAQAGMVCKYVKLSNGESCFMNCKAADNCGTAVAKDDNIIYAYPTNVVVGSVQNGEYNCCPNEGTDDYCDETKYDCEYEECSGKWINNGCNLAYFDMEAINNRYSTCPTGTYLDKCMSDEIYYTCSDPVYGPDTLNVTLNITPSYWGNCSDYQIGKYNISVIFTDLNGNQIKASANNITRYSGSLTINFDKPIPVGRYNVDIVGSFSGGINQCNSVTYHTHEWSNGTPTNEGMWILGTPYKSLPSGGIDIDVHKGMSPIITLYMYLGGFS